MSTSSTLDDALASGWFGAGLPDVARAQLAELAEMTSFAAGSVVLQEGGPVESLGTVVDGRLAIRLKVPGRDVVTVLTNRAIPAAQIDTAAAATELEQAQARRATTDDEQSEKAKAVARARAQLRVAVHGV